MIGSRFALPLRNVRREKPLRFLPIPHPAFYYTLF